MKKIFIALVLSIAILLPTTAAFAAPGFGANLPCTVWREGNGTSYAPSNCKGADETNRRLYELEVALDSLKAENAQLRNANISNNNALIPAPVYNVTNSFDQGTVQRITQLEFKVAAQEKTIAALNAKVATLEKGVATINKTLSTAVANITKLLKKK